MLFNSFQFIWLFPLIFIIYYAFSYIHNTELQHRVTNGLLLVISYLLYAQWNVPYTLLLVLITALTFIGALVIEKQQAYGKKKYIITIFVLLAFLPLIIFKYYDFIHFQVGAIMSSFNIGMEMAGLNWAVPLGISFYTFQAVGYLWDVYYKRIEAEHNWWDYMLFVAFFPQIMSGPISKAQDLLPQIKRHREFDYNGAVIGCKWLLWGMFLKVVFADRIGTLVDTIIPNYMYLNGTTCAIGAIGYSLQIYGDFAGYSLMAIGVGKIMGFDLINNFKRPYFAATITEFWKRWHISLTKWLTSYIYIPLGGSRCSKLKTYRNILVTFLVSGIWHGANWTFIFWGTLHGVFQVIEKAMGLQECKKDRYYLYILRILLTFILVTIAWIFFRTPTIRDGFLIVEKIFTSAGPFIYHGAKTDLLVIVMAITMVFAKDWFNEYRPKVSLMNNRYAIIRWSTYLSLIVIIVLCGVLDSGTFIYVNF